MIELKKDMLILFQGDSVTDTGRFKDGEAPTGYESNLGYGYPMLVSAVLNSKFFDLNLRFINRGVNGDSVAKLQARWQADTLNHKPDVVSVMVGVNDMWRRIGENNPVSPQEFEDSYRDILSQTESIGAKIIIIEPFINIIRDEMNYWHEDLMEKIPVCRKLSREFNTEYIPMDSIMQEAGRLCSPQHWTLDGAHPTVAGHGLIAENYLKIFGVSIK